MSGGDFMKSWMYTYVDMWFTLISVIIITIIIAIPGHNTSTIYHIATDIKTGFFF